MRTAILILLGLALFVGAWCWACVIVGHGLDDARRRGEKDVL